MKYVWVDIKENYFMNIKILIPVYNDWKSTFRLLDDINSLDLNKEFKVNKQKVVTIMETFGGTTEELYRYVASKFDYNRLSKKKAIEIFKLNNI